MRIIERSKDVAIKLWKDESGASLLEYSVLIGIITVGAIASISSVGTWVSTKWSTLNTTLGSP